MRMPTVSIIMGIYNEKRRDHVAEAITSMLKQSYTDFEFIICDDGSEEVFFQWLKEYCQRDERIILIRKEKNEGLASALNTGIQKAKGKYLARMDADDISRPQRLEKQVAFLEQHPKYALAGCCVELIDDTGVWGERKVKEKPGKQDFLFTSAFIHPSIMIRADVMRSLHGYSLKDYALRTEDYELFMRLYAAGYCGYNFQEILFQYREDGAAFAKRKYRYRMNEAKVRYIGFRSLGILKGHMHYVLKPLIVGLIPAGWMQKQRKKQFGVQRQ